MRPLVVLLAGAGFLLAASPAIAAVEPTPDLTASESSAAPVSTQLSDDRVILRFRAGVDATDRAQAVDGISEDAASLGKRFQVVTLAEGVDIKQAVAELKSNPDVLDATPDGYSEPLATNDPLYNQLWGLQNQGLNIGGVSSSTVGSDIDAVNAWAKTTGDLNTVVAVLDGGYRPQHPDLKDRLWTNADEVPGDSLDNDGNGFVDDANGMDFVGASGDSPTTDNDPTDDVPQGGHGVHVAGTIAATGDNGAGITGVAQKASIMPLRVCGWMPSANGIRCPFSSTIAAINYAGANGARVANLSLGGIGFNSVYRDAFAANPNTLFVIAAGNDGWDNEISANTTYPCSYDPSTSGISGAVDNIICVAASNQSDARASFSNWGRTKVDVAAPGTEILSSYVTTERARENFEAGDPVGWTLDGWSRVSSAPLTSFGMTNGVQAGQVTRTLKTSTVSVTGPSQCTVSFWRKLTSTGNDDQAVNDKFTYAGLVDGAPVSTTTGFSQAAGNFSLSFPVGSGTRQVGAQFAFRKGISTASTNGVWIDDVKLDCYVPPGGENSTSYAFLQGTSMAAPQVAGAATLLAAYEPNATVTQMRSAVFTSVDPVAQFNPTTGAYPISTGGRLNADAALTELDKAVTPETSMTSTTTTGANASFGFTTSSKAPATFECKLDAGSYAACTSVRSLTGLSAGSHTFSVRAKDQYGNTDASPATHTWNVAAAPTVTGVSPVSGPTAGGTVVTVTGTNFTGTPTVTFGGTACSSVNRNSATSLTCTTNARVAGAVTVVVTNPDTQSASKANAYTYLNPAPTVTGVSPTSGPAAGGTNVTVTGTGFTGTPTVSFGGSACNSVNRTSSTSLTCTTTAHAAGAVTVTVTNADTQQGSKSTAFTYVDAPTVLSVSPNSGPTPGGTSVTLTGTGFTGTPSVTFGGAACTAVNRTSATSLTCVTPARPAGAVTVIVTNPDTQQGSKPTAYTYVAAPTVVSVSPSGGPLAGGAAVTVAGTGFTGTPTVTFGGAACTSVNRTSATSLTCVTPARPAGAVTVVVTNSDSQQGSKANAYTYASAPTVNGVNPASGPMAGGTTITLSGTGFSGVPTVTVDGRVCSDVTPVNATTVTCRTPSSPAPGAVGVELTNPDSQKGSKANAFTYIAPVPALDGVSPARGPIEGGTLVTLSGSGFWGKPTVEVGDVACQAVTVVDAKTLTCTTGPGAKPGPVDVVLTDQVEQSAGSAAAFTFEAPAPVVAGVDPASGPTDGGTLITVTGSGFYANTTATVGGQPCTSLSVLSPTALTCATPAGAAGVVPVAVRNADDRSGVRDAAFTYVAPIPPVVKDEVVVGKVSVLKAKRIKAGKAARLSWATASNAVRYEFGCVVKGKKLTKWTSVTSAKARCVGLKPSKTYRAYVRAVGETTFSPAVSVKIRRLG